MRTYKLKRLTIPKVAVLATALAAGVMVATVDMRPAQAWPTQTAACTGCHTAGGSVTATPSSATVAPGAAYTVALVFTGGTSPVGYNITGNGEPAVTGSTAGPVNMTAPAAAGTYTYTVWMRAGVVATVDYTITVGAATTTTEPPTSTSTTEPPTSTSTTEPPTSTTTAPAPTCSPRHDDDDDDDGDDDGDYRDYRDDHDGDDPDGDDHDDDSSPTCTPSPSTTTPSPSSTTPSSDDDLSPTSARGVRHLNMYSLYGAMACTTCHKAGGSAAAAPSINMEAIAMAPGIACASCHAAGGEESDEPLFTNLMNGPAPKIVYDRCDSCHVVTGSSET